MRIAVNENKMRITVLGLIFLIALPPVLSVAADADPGLQDELNALARKTAVLRGTAQGLEPPPVAERAPTELITTAAEIRAAGVIPLPVMKARGRAWADIGLGGPELPAKIFRSLGADLSGVGLDIEGNRLLIDVDRLSDSDFFGDSPDDPSLALLMATGIRPDEPLIIHSLMHLAQSRRGQPEVQTTDMLLAAHAVAEGEANLTAVLFLLEALGLRPNILSMGYSPDQALDGALMPSAWNHVSGIEKRVLEFVYLDGFETISLFYQSQGWKAVDRGMRRLRRTHDLIHPDRGSAMTPAPDPQSPALPETYRLVDQDSIGELGVQLVISEQTGKDNLGLQAGDGWMADGLFRYEGAAPLDPETTGVTVWVSVWRSPQHAAKFASFYRRGLTEGTGDGQQERGRFSRRDDRVLTIRTTVNQVLIQVGPASLLPPVTPAPEE